MLQSSSKYTLEGSVSGWVSEWVRWIEWDSIVKEMQCIYSVCAVSVKFLMDTTPAWLFPQFYQFSSIFHTVIQLFTCHFLAFSFSLRFLTIIRICFLQTFTGNFLIKGKIERKMNRCVFDKFGLQLFPKNTRNTIECDMYAEVTRRSLVCFLGPV